MTTGTTDREELAAGGNQERYLAIRGWPGHLGLPVPPRRGRRQNSTPYLVLLDIRIPKIDGIEVLRQIKQDELLRKIPVIMLTTMDDPRRSTPVTAWDAATTS